MMARRSQADLTLDPVLVLVLVLAVVLVLVLVVALALALALVLALVLVQAALLKIALTRMQRRRTLAWPASLLCVMHSRPFHDASRDTTADTSRWMISGGAFLSARLSLAQRV